jgi:putative hydrolase of the HAD superfamily
MFDQSKPFNEMLQLMQKLKTNYNINIAVLSNEGRELAEYRIRQFKLNEFVDFFIVSSFVHFRKPDTDIFKIALDTAQVAAEQVLYLEDRAMFVQVAETLGIQGLKHNDCKSTIEKLAKWGFKL